MHLCSARVHYCTVPPDFTTGCTQLFLNADNVRHWRKLRDNTTRLLWRHSHPPSLSLHYLSDLLPIIAFIYSVLLILFLSVGAVAVGAVLTVIAAVILILIISVVVT